MRREVVYTFTDAERAVLTLARVAAEVEELAHKARGDAIEVAVDLGIPVRTVGEAAKYSGAAVSRRTARREVGGL